MKEGKPKVAALTITDEEPAAYDTKATEGEKGSPTVTLSKKVPDGEHCDTVYLTNLGIRE